MIRNKLQTSNTKDIIIINHKICLYWSKKYPLCRKRRGGFTKAMTNDECAAVETLLQKMLLNCRYQQVNVKTKDEESDSV